MEGIFEPGDLVIAAGPGESSIAVWNVQTQTFVTSFRDNASDCNAITAIGGHHIAAAQTGKSRAIHVWTWSKEQVLQRSWPPQPLMSLACSPDGIFLAGGSEKGSIFIWSTTSGNLLYSWPAHYRGVTSLAFTADGTTLISAGADAVISAWLMMDVIGAADRQEAYNTRPTPLHTMSHHMLPVTGLCLGASASNPVLASVSMDQSCKLWSLATVQMGLWEEAVYTGAEDGRVFEIGLLGGQEGDFKKASPHLSSTTSLGDKECRVLLGHTGAVNSLAMTSHGHNLLSGSQDSTVRIWDVQSRQAVWVIQAKGPITALLVLPETSSSETGQLMTGRALPVGVLNKHAIPNGASADLAPAIIIDGSQSYRGIAVKSGLMGIVRGFNEDKAGPSSTRADNLEEVRELEKRNKELGEQVEAASKTIQSLRAMNSKLHAFVVDKG